MYHVLYADEVRLGSLDAQLNKSVPVRLTEKDEFGTMETISGEGGIAEVLKGSQANTKTKAESTTTEYAFLDARYFDILERLNINLEQPEDFSPEIIDGNIHIFRGVLKISGMSIFAPILKSLQAILPVMRKNPTLFDMKKGKNNNDIKAMEDIAKLLPQMPIPSHFRLSLRDMGTIIGPIDDNAVRLNMENMMLLFNGRMPFDWLVVGYLYPFEQSFDDTFDNSNFISQTEITIQSITEMFIPQADAILLPLLILR